MNEDKDKMKRHKKKIKRIRRRKGYPIVSIMVTILTLFTFNSLGRYMDGYHPT